MNRLLKLVFVMVIFLDVAVFPFSCGGSRESNRVMIHFMTEYLDDENNVQYSYISKFYAERRFENFIVGDTITEDDVMDYIRTNEESNELPFTIEKYQVIINEEGRHVHKDITLPYVVAAEDKLPYLRGMRGYVHLVVVVKMNAEEGASE